MGSPRPSDIGAPVLAEERVMSNVVTPYQTVHLVLTDRDLRVRWPQSLLGVIPVGETSLTVPLSELHGFRMTHTMIFGRLLVALVLGALPFVVDVPRWLVGFILVLAIWLLLVAVIGALEVIHGGHRTVIPVCLLQKGATTRFINEVMLVQRSGDRGSP